jgi:hypothetical protein
MLINSVSPDMLVLNIGAENDNYFVLRKYMGDISYSAVMREMALNSRRSAASCVKLGRTVKTTINANFQWKKVINTVDFCGHATMALAL